MKPIDAFLSHLFAHVPTDLPEHIPFREYLETCMFHPQVGYYGSGKVRIGMAAADYWTFPVRMSPLFGEILSHRVLELWRAIGPRVTASGQVFTVAEVGGGRGELLRDLLLALRRRAETDREAAALVERIAPLAVDKSPSLLADQAVTLSELGGRFVNASIAELGEAMPRPFFGLIFANEVLTLLAPEILHLEGPSVSRLGILPWLGPALASLTVERPGSFEIPGVDPGYRPLRPGALPDLIQALSDDTDLLRSFIDGRLAAWTGVLEPIDLGQETAIAHYLDFLQPAIQRLDRLGALPAWVVFAPEDGKALQGLADVLNSGAGAFLTIDYGGTAYHVVDNHCRHPHLRTFSRYLEEEGDEAVDKERKKDIHNPFYAPGIADLTYDLDFTWVAHYLKEKGLVLCNFSHQGALEGEVDLWSKPYQKQLVAGRLRESYRDVEAVILAHDLLKRFRSGAGFRLLVMATPGLAGVFPSLGPSDPLFFEDFEGLPDTIDREAMRPHLVDRLVREGLAAEKAQQTADTCLDALHPTGSVVDDLGDALMYYWRFVVLDLLRSSHRPGGSNPSPAHSVGA